MPSGDTPRRRAPPPPAQKSAAVPAINAEDSGADAELTPESPGRYQLKREYGRGGMSIVYLALDRHTGREVALKQLLPEHLESQSESDTTTSPASRFVKEARITAQLEHPSIVPVYEVGRREDGSLYYTQKLVRGRTLAAALKRTQTLDERLRLLSHFTDLCQAIGYAHRRGVIHRDIKPDNVMVDEFGETVVLDWGIAKVQGQRDTAARLFEREQAGDETEEGMVMGTPSYMSPEQAVGSINDIDERSDVWSLGTVLYEILTGRTPFLAKGPMEMILKVASDAIIPVRQLEKNAPPELAAVAEKALSRDRSARYANGKEVADEIEKFQSGARVSAYEYSSVELIKRFIAKNRALTAVISAAVLLVTGAAIFSAYKYRDAQRELSRALSERSTRAEQDLRWDRALVLAAAARVGLDQPEVDFRLAQGAPRQLAPAGSFPQSGAPYALAFAPDGRSVALALPDHTIEVVQLPSGRKLHLLEGNDATVVSIAFTPDGRSIATAGEDGSARLFSLETNEVSFKSSLGGAVHAVALSPDGALLAAAGSEGVVALYSLSSSGGTEEARLVGHQDEVNALAFSPDGKLLASAAGDGTVRLWDPLAHTAGARLLGHQGAVSGLGFLAGGDALITAGRDGTVRFWDAATGLQTDLLEPKQGPLQSLALSGDLKTFAVVDVHGGVLVGDATNRTIAARLPDREPYTTVAFSSDGKQLAAGLRNSSLRLFSVIPGSVAFALPSPPPFLSGRSISFSPDRKTVAAGSAGGPLSIWDLQSRTQTQLLIGHFAAVTALAYSADGKRLASGSFDGNLLVWDVAQGAVLTRLDGHEAAVTGLSFAGASNVLVSGSTDKSVSVWDSSSGRLLRKIEHLPAIDALAVTPDGALLAVGGEELLLKLFDVKTGKLERELPETRGAVLSLAFSPDGKMLAAGYKDGSAGLWRIPGGGKRGLFRGHSERIWSLAFSPDSETLATASHDGTVRLWDTETRLPVAVLQRGEVQAVAFSRDGKLLGTAGGNPPVQIRELADRTRLLGPGAELERQQKRYGLELHGIDLIESSATPAPRPAPPKR